MISSLTVIETFLYKGGAGVFENLLGLKCVVGLLLNAEHKIDLKFYQLCHNQ